MNIYLITIGSMEWLLRAPTGRAAWRWAITQVEDYSDLKWRELTAPELDAAQQRGLVVQDVPA